MKKTTSKSSRQAAIEASYKHAKANNLTVNDAASWGTKQYGNRLNKSEIQYWAMKNNLPYLDEIIKGIRRIVL